MGRIGILAGAGKLPVMVQNNYPDALAIRFDGMASDVKNAHVFRFEHLGAMFDLLTDQNVSRVCMVGGISRPKLDPTLFDDGMKEIAPRLASAMAGGDDGLLKTIITLFAERGFETVGVHELLPELTATDGVLTKSRPTDQQIADIGRADTILSALSPVDIGQAVVVEQGICLGIETIQGTDFLLGQVNATRAQLRRGSGVLVKRPKIGQDLRVDMPTIGPATVQNAARAGLAGIAISSGSVLLVDRNKLLDDADELGLFIVAGAPE
jgi:DUF1009 family protein